MRNLKRALSLALTAVMVLGMMVIGAGAVSYDDFSDKDKIVNTEAVSTLVELGVIAGKDDGSYDPSGIVTRAEMAKMICVVLNGGKDPQLGTVSTYTYSDTVTSWAASYIEYCTTLGIVAGDGTGKFNPTATVTGAQAAKMLLVAAGYQAAIQGYTGANWANAVNVDANGVGLYDELSINPSAGLTRDDAAQMVYNVLSAKMVTYDYTLVSDGKGGFTSIPTLKDDSSAKTVLESKFGVLKVEGVVTDNEFVSGSGLADKTTIDVSNYDSNGTQDVFNGLTTFKVTTGADEIGKSVTLFVKPSGSSSVGTKATVVGSAIVNSNNVVYSTAKKLVDDSTSSSDITKTLKAEGLKFSNTNAVTKYLNYADSTVTNPVTNIASLLNGKGVEAQYIDNNGDGIVDVVTQLVRSFGKVTVLSTASDGSLTISNLSKYQADGTAGTDILSTTDASDDVADFDNLSVEKNDYAFYYQVNGDLYYVEKADSADVSISATKSDTVYDGSTSYTASSLARVSDMSSESGNQTSLGASVSAGNDAKFYLDTAGYVVYVTEADTTASYLMVTATALGSYSDSLSARVVYEDGTTGSIDINKVTKIDGTSITVNSDTKASDAKAYLDAGKLADGSADALIYTYTKADDAYNLTAKPTTVALNQGIANNTPTIVSNVLVANTATKFVVESDGDYTGYVGINEVPSRTAADVYAYISSGKTAKIVFTFAGTGATSSNNYMYVLSATPYTTSPDGKSVYTYDVIRKGEITTVLGSDGTDFTSAGLNKVTFSGDKAASGSTIQDDVLIPSSLATAASDGVVTNATGSYFYDSNTKFFLITGDDPKEDVAEVSADSIITEGGAQDYISILLNSTDTSTADYVFIERG